MAVDVWEDINTLLIPSTARPYSKTDPRKRGDNCNKKSYTDNLKVVNILHVALHYGILLISHEPLNLLICDRACNRIYCTLVSVKINGCLVVGGTKLTTCGS